MRGYESGNDRARVIQRKLMAQLVIAAGQVGCEGVSSRLLSVVRSAGSV